MAPGSGFLTAVNGERLVAAAEAADVVIELDKAVGSAIVEATPIAVVRPAGDEPLASETLDQLQSRVTDTLTFSFERTGTHDVGFGLRQLTDVATRALSPGMNDPTTAVHALSHSAALLCAMSRFELGPQVLHDTGGSPRVRLLQPSFHDLLDLALSQPRHYGITDSAVVTAMVDLLRSVALTVELPEQRCSVTAELGRMRTAVGRQEFDEATRTKLKSAFAGVEEALRRPV